MRVLHTFVLHAFLAYGFEPGSQPGCKPMRVLRTLVLYGAKRLPFGSETTHPYPLFLCLMTVVVSRMCLMSLTS